MDAPDAVPEETQAEVTAERHVLVVGESLVDVTRTADGEQTVRPGGSPLNVAVGLSRLEVTTTLATQIGDDEHGELVRDHLDASDVDVRALPPRRGDTGTAVATLDATGAASYEFDLVWDPSELPDPADFDLLHVGSLGVTLAPGADAVARLAAAAHEARRPVSLDPNVRPSLTPDLTEVRRLVLGVAAHATVVKLSDEDAELLWPGADDEALWDVLGTSGAPLLLALTRGADGAVLRSADARVEVAAPATEVVDTIGAGDAFTAALLAGLLERPLPSAPLDADALRALGALCVDAAALTCARPGADPPRRADLPTHLDPR